MTEFVLAVTLGLLFGLGTFLVLRRDVVRVVWGVAIISQAANVYLVTVGVGTTGGASAPILGHGHAGGAAVVDPLVQALVLTAIVIGFGTTAFALVLTFRLYEEHGTIDLDGIAGSGGGGGGGDGGPDGTGGSGGSGGPDGTGGPDGDDAPGGSGPGVESHSGAGESGTGTGAGTRTGTEAGTGVSADG